MSEGKNEKGKSILSGIAALLTTAGVAIGHSMENAGHSMENAGHSIHDLPSGDKFSISDFSSMEPPKTSKDLPNPNLRSPKIIPQTTDINTLAHPKARKKIKLAADDAAYLYISTHQDSLTLVEIKSAAEDAARKQNGEQGHVLSDAAVTTIVATSAIAAYSAWQNNHKDVISQPIQPIQPIPEF